VISTSDIHGAKVLIVDDQPSNILLLDLMLSGTGYSHIASTINPHEVCALHRENRYDLIILDVEMPGMDGFQVMEGLKELEKDGYLPVLVITAEPEHKLRALTAGAKDFISKPFDMTEVLTRVYNMLEVRLLHLETARLYNQVVAEQSAQKVIEEALFEERERAQITLNSIGDAVACTDALGRISYLNLAAERMTGWSLQEAAGRPMAEVLQFSDAATRQIIENPMALAIEHNRAVSLSLNCVLLRRDGLEIPIEDSAAPIHDRGGRTTGAVVVFRDVSVGRAMALQVRHSAEHDFLTGLPNRMLLHERIRQAIAQASRHGRKVAVLFLDLDGFKHINDSLGHPTGDKLLQSIAKRLVNCVRSTDTISRQGGDEFVVLLNEVEQWEDAADLAKKLLEAVAQAHSIDQRDLFVTTSIGVSIFPDDGQDAEILIKNADAAMYQAKENGRQRYRFFKPTMNTRAAERQSTEGDGADNSGVAAGDGIFHTSSVR
jgi:diguanylate cyclase (GGDEF)-like protein/PAS domain S-box-containing protein